MNNKTAAQTFWISLILVSCAHSQQANNGHFFPRAMDQPKLVDPQKFKIESATSNGRGEVERESTDLVDRLSTPRLRGGIGTQPFQRTIYNRAVEFPSVNHSYLASAYLAPQPASSPQQFRTWESPNMAHRPLHFEDENLERYGNNQKLQSIRSGMHFFKSVVFLPHSFGKYGNECQFSLGYYRPGDCNPAFLPDTSKSAKGLLYQTAAFGLIAIGLD